MYTTAEDQFTGRDRTRLERARTNGYLNAICRSHQRVARAFGFWCWRLRIPVVWFERKTPRSKYGTVRLDMFTTPNLLTPKGEAELKSAGRRLQLTGPAVTSAHDGSWGQVPVARLDELARAIYRIATRAGNYEVREPNRASDTKRTVATPGRVLPWRISA